MMMGKKEAESKRVLSPAKKEMLYALSAYTILKNTTKHYALTLSWLRFPLKHWKAITLLLLSIVARLH